MQNKFGLKDFIITVLIVLVGVSVWLSMVQDDRKWKRLDGTEYKIKEIETHLARIQSTLDRGVPVNAVQATGSPAQTNTTSAASTDDAWAKPGYEVTRGKPWGFETDPYAQEGFEAGGGFTEMLEGQPPKITPYLYADVYGRRVNDLVTESLGWYNPVSLKMEGRLAEAWQYDPKGMWLRVKIDGRARFSNGDPVLAEDVRFTYQDLMFNPEIEAERFRSVYNAIKDIKIVGDPETSRVVEFEFFEPRFDNLDQALGFGILPKSVYSKWIESPTRFNESTGLAIGSGPFKLERVDENDQWTPPTDVVLVRNELYWAFTPPLAEYRYKVVQNRQALLTAYTNGEGDMMRCTPEQYDAKTQDAKFLEKNDARKWFNMRGGYAFIAWQCGERNGKLTPFHDKRVRQAMTMIVDRDKIRRDIEENLTRVATGPFLSSTPQSDPEVKPWPHDLDKARELLAEAGWVDRDQNGVLENERGDEFEFEITFGQGSQGTLRMCELIKADCAKVGIRMNLRPIDWSTLQPILNTRDFDAVTFAWSASAPESDPTQIWSSKSIANQGDNFIQWSCPEADALIDKGRATLDFDQRMEIWHELHRVFHEEQPYTYLSEIPWTRFTTKRSHNIQEYNSGLEYYEFWVSRESQPMEF